MVDKINGNSGFGPLGNASRTTKKSAAGSASASKSDSIDFSSALQSATKTQGTTATQDSARAEKIQALKAQIQDGTYKPDLEKVAASVLPFLVKG
jgi:negative regulator of flagellin synthesis FlgM